MKYEEVSKIYLKKKEVKKEMSKKGEGSLMKENWTKEEFNALTKEKRIRIIKHLYAQEKRIRRLCSGLY